MSKFCEKRKYTYTTNREVLACPAERRDHLQIHRRKIASKLDNSEQRESDRKSHRDVVSSPDGSRRSRVNGDDRNRRGRMKRRKIRVDSFVKDYSRVQGENYSTYKRYKASELLEVRSLF